MRLLRPITASGVAVILAFATGCSDSDGGTPSPTPTPASAPRDDVPVFDPDVPDGVETDLETDEGRNQGFEADEPSGRTGGLD